MAGWGRSYQLRILQRQVADEAQRNVKRDELVDRQLADAETRALYDRRTQAEDVVVSVSVFNGELTGYVVNNSRRPVSDITCEEVRAAIYGERRTRRRCYR